MRIVLAAEESAGLQVLRMLLGSAHELIAVLASEPKPETTGATVWKTAKNAGRTVWPGSLVKGADFGLRLQRENVDLLLNVHSLHVMHEEVLRAARLGAFNLHPAPLPRYAGLSSVSWAICNGEATHGVTVHRMEPQIDCGAIAYQDTFPIEEEESALSLSLRCVRQGVVRMAQLLEDAAVGTIPALAQDLSLRTWHGRNPPNKGWIDWTWQGRRVLDFIRACDYRPFESPWGNPKAKVGAQTFALIEARKSGRRSDAPPGLVGDRTDSGVYIGCADEWILAEKVLHNGRVSPAAEFLRSGDRLQPARSGI